MADGKIRFALFAPQLGSTFEAMLEKAMLAQELGYHSLWLPDHMWSRGLTDIDNLECLATLSALAARTDRIRLGALVLCNAFRNPALLAKMLSTIDNISHGRLEVGLGAGWQKEEFTAYGWEFAPTPVRLRQLEDSLRILHAMFTQPKATVEGQMLSVTEAYNHPQPVQKPHPPITLGGTGRKVMLRLVAQYADRWNIPAGYQDLPGLLATLRAHCTRSGRDFSTLEVSEQLLVCMGHTPAEVERNWQRAARMRPFASTAIKGTPSELVEALRARVAQGIQTFMLFFSDYAAPDTLRTFAREVFPAFA